MTNQQVDGFERILVCIRYDTDIGQGLQLELGPFRRKVQKCSHLPPSCPSLRIILCQSPFHAFMKIQNQVCVKCAGLCYCETVIVHAWPARALQLVR